MDNLTLLIKEDMKPALGVTETGAIAFAVAKARSYTKGEVERIHVSMNSGMFKNAFTCGIPNSLEVGNLYAAALGALAGDPNKGLESLQDVTPDDNIKAKRLIDEGKVSVDLSSISSDIFIEATVLALSDKAIVTIRDSHTNITKIVVNDVITFNKEIHLQGQASKPEEGHMIHNYRLEDLYNYISNVNIGELDFIGQAFDMNLDLFNEGLSSPRTTFAKHLLKLNNGEIISKDELKTAQLLCNATIEARVIGLDKPAMSITGSGAHGIIATMPLYAVYKINNLSEEKLLRATALSYLVTMYIKEYSGRLSASCGCAIAAGTGMACGLVFLKDGTIDHMTNAINNMASSISGIICDGGNQGCTMLGAH